MGRIARKLVFVFLFLGISTPSYADVRMKGLNVPDTFKLYDFPRPAPTATFKDGRGKTVSLKDFKGKILIVNMWASNCPRCVVELPMLNRLQRDMGGLKFHVIALAAGRETQTGIRYLWAKKELSDLDIYIDDGDSFSMAAGVLGLPTTLLVDGEGQELGRIRGMAEWDGPTIKAQIREMIRREKAKPPAKKEESNKPKEAESDVPPPPDRKNEFSSWFK